MGERSGEPHAPAISERNAAYEHLASLRQAGLKLACGGRGKRGNSRAVERRARTGVVNRSIMIGLKA
jgi:hypothetical protein